MANGTKCPANAPRDALTGLYTRAAFLTAAQALPPQGGALAVLDVDSLRRVNLRCGHAQGDALLKEAARALCALSAPEDILGRVSGGSFAVFAPEGTCGALHARAAQVEGCIGHGGQAYGNVTFSTGITERHGAEPFTELWERALRLLDENKGSRAPRRADHPPSEAGSVDTDLARLHSGLREKNAPRGAMCVKPDEFSLICHFVERRLRRVPEPAHLLLLTLTDENGGFIPLEGRAALMEQLREDIRLSLRASDVYTRTSECQYVVLILGAQAASMGVIAARITARFTARLPARVVLRADIAPVGEETI